MISTILVALDGSIRASAVLDAAIDIARRFQSSIVAFRALAIPADYTPGGGDDLAKQVAAEARRDLEAMCARAPDLAVTTRVDVSAQPWRAILGVSDELDVDLIVVGSHGYHGVDRIIGTTAAKVVNLARRNVLVVHERNVGRAIAAPERVL